ncbi:MAG: hypothetical protein IKL10_00360 [Clostridia bacterium]|nr:hypothetical protein [Clostridia bacterium]
MKKIKNLLTVVLALIIFLAPVSGVAGIKAEAAGNWACSWATSIVNSSVSLASLSLQDIIPAKSTVRIELKVTTGGEKLRFEFSNEYGSSPVVISEATVAKTLGEGKADIVASTATAITFNGNTEGTIPAGKTIWSDEIDFKTQALDALTVSLYFANSTYITSAGLSNARTFMGLRSVFREEVSQCYEKDLLSPREVNISSGTITYHTTPFLSQIDTYSTSGADVAVFIGDSTLVNDTYYYFAEKLVKAGIKNVSVVNEAVVANKLLSDGTGLIGNLYGKALRDRFERDALSITGVKYIFVKIGLNDILHQFSKSMGADVPHPTSEDIIAGYKNLVKKAHAKGIKIYFFTKTSWKGYERAFLGQTGDIVWTQQMQDMCDELDKWIKINTSADGYIDCSALSNPADTNALCPTFTTDGAHLTPLASIALADLIPVSFVGVNNSNIKNAAYINKVDPYKERREILYDLEHQTETTTKEEPTTEKPTEPTTKKEESTTAPAPTEEATTAPTYIPPEIVTVPVIGGADTAPDSQAGLVDPDYNITDTVPEEIGNGAPIVFILVLFLVIVVSGTIVFLTLGRKKEEEFE